MSQAEEDKNADLLSKTRDRVADAISEFQHGLGKVKNPAERRKLAVAYVELLQHYLDKAQQNLTRYHGKLQGTENAELPDDQAPRPAPGDSEAGGT